ncbi:MAG TPA: His/Gly/Thr/Pro-type tRNA ligase C-terminal domain-containing protein, partial [Syntrophales bacterium]|nr:His/Gly/Thr/Pro-type tRNA ligase C-terminal domain-containing protein [Syntrophales bacterium]
LAPYAVIITPVNSNEETLSRAAESLYQALSVRGVEVLLDDRDERAGVKFKDADLIGIPLRITVGPKKLAEGRVELRIRRSGEVRTLPLGEAADGVCDLIRAESERIGG